MARDYDKRIFGARLVFTNDVTGESQEALQDADMRDRHEWLRNRLKELGKLQKGLAEALGLPPSRVNEMISGKREVTARELAIIAAYIEWSPAQVLAKLIPHSPASAWAPNLDPATIATRAVRVVGALQAGMFMDSIEWPPGEQYDIAIPVSEPYQLSQLQAFKVIGPSMNKIYPEGSLVVAVPTIDNWVPKTGMRVIVQRRSVVGTEATVKEIEIKGNTILLWPRSDHPSWQRPFKIERAQRADRDDDEISITGLVIRSVREEPDS